MTFAYLNGKIIKASEAKVSIFDRGFVLGDGLFETLRAVDYIPEFWSNHFKRLKKSATRLKIPLNISQIELGLVISNLCKKSKIKDTGVRITLTRGKYDGGLSIEKPMHPTLAIGLIPSVLADNSIYIKGVPVAISSINKEAASGLDSSVKTINYLANIFAKNEADKQNCYEAILLGKNGEIAELSTSSFFCVINNSMFTPPLDSGILPGITRDEVIKLAKKASMKILEKSVKLKNIPKMKEAFLTSSIRGIVPVTKIGPHTVGSGDPGNKTLHLMEDYSAHCSNNRRKFEKKYL